MWIYEAEYNYLKVCINGSNDFTVNNAHNILLLLSDYEGFSLPLLEAQSFGIPVVCSDIPIFREILNNSAIFVNNNDIKKIGDEIINLVENNLFREKIIELGFSNLERFSWEKWLFAQWNLTKV